MTRGSSYEEVTEHKNSVFSDAQVSFVKGLGDWNSRSQHDFNRELCEYLSDPDANKHNAGWLMASASWGGSGDRINADELAGKFKAAIASMNDIVSHNDLSFHIYNALNEAELRTQFNFFREYGIPVKDAVELAQIYNTFFSTQPGEYTPCRIGRLSQQF